MKKTLFTLAIIGLLMLNACERANNEPVPVPDYYQLKPGNYWVYDVIETLNDTTIMYAQQTDSVCVEKDTVINAFTYSKVRGTNSIHHPYTYFLRDSLGYLVNSFGQVHFSADNFSDTIYVYTVYDVVRVAYKMDANDSVVSVPAGSYSCLFNRCTITALKTYMDYTTKTHGEFRAEGIGMVMSTNVNAASGNYKIQKKLLRYHVGIKK